ncbi:hypothetical protein [Novosphingobium jiangmenense]|uniref:Uncharacterized protein n=1 Tax=Novosphingobium jiangmenense TaxID=2791981 RepID=A0ABS0HIT8_9SPHN|nr:hypothetical protein [Novosphingobium jiangmenense]MBF9151925.1 hypothetical protein [Novosphingobium jiangmenense]
MSVNEGTAQTGAGPALCARARLHGHPAEFQPAIVCNDRHATIILP